MKLTKIQDRTEQNRTKLNKSKANKNKCKSQRMKMTKEIKRQSREKYANRKKWKNGDIRNIPIRTFFKSYAETHGQTTSYLPCTMTVGI